MSDTPNVQASPQAQPDSKSGKDKILSSDWVSELDDLLDKLNRATSGGATPVIDRKSDSELVQVRLGIAASLFTTMRCRHMPIASHCLRTALEISAWSLKLDLTPKQRDVIEIAAILHDIGMIGVPDQILAKPGRLTAEEKFAIEQSRQMGIDILRDACAEEAVLGIIANLPAWFDGSKPGFQACGQNIPLGARMLAIVEAYDSMTTDQIFRSAMSQERAIHELFKFAGTQFDPMLVQQFAELKECDQSILHREVSQRWLSSLAPEVVNSYWEFNRPKPAPAQADPQNDFHHRLLKNMLDAVVFIDENYKITLWNNGAERMTGISATSICHKKWVPELLNMMDERGKAVTPADCPIQRSIGSGVQGVRRLTITGRDRRPISVDSQVIPVASEEGQLLGAVLIMHDASSETSLEERCQALYAKSTKDSLTQVANRAEYDRVHETFIMVHLQQRIPCSMIICDLDRFKSVNDNFGHQAGDDVIKSLASFLKSSCRPGDLVARYGGEEFVVLCAGCNNAAASARAEQIRKSLSQTAQPKMNGRKVTASFGVTEIQPGDSPETMLRRADRALMMAKDKGRNTVVQLGSGSSEEVRQQNKGLWKSKQPGSAKALEQVLITSVPISVAIEKLRGFVSDHQAKITKIDKNTVDLQLDDRAASKQKRRSDRPITFDIKLQFSEESVDLSNKPSSAEQKIAQTKISVSITPSQGRNRRQNETIGRARNVLASFRSYLMATEETEPTTNTLDRAKNILTPWRKKR